MAVSRNPDEWLSLEPAEIERARQVGLFPVHLVFDVMEGVEDSPDWIPAETFMFVNVIPRPGEIVVLHDGKVARVQNITYMMGRNAGFNTLIPSVLLYLNPDDPHTPPAWTQ